MSRNGDDNANDFTWSVQPGAAELVGELVQEVCRNCEAANQLREHLRERTGTRLGDWIDHLVVPTGAMGAERLAGAGFQAEPGDAWGAPGGTVWSHPEGLFPLIVTRGDGPRGLAIRAESVADFLVAWQIDGRTSIEGLPLGPLRRATFAAVDGVELQVVERHGYRGLDPAEASDVDVQSILSTSEALRRRVRRFGELGPGLEQTLETVETAVALVGADRACELFFAAEREYWQGRNRAAQVQRSRQDALGLGWANHDHHTYRSSREAFSRLIGLLERLGCVCRERFYAGREAGWGAQVLEQKAAGIVVFADVDLSPDEVAGDFAHQSLPPRAELGTVGLWCRLHGEALLEAGMHHLECQFDFDQARRQLAERGVNTMEPFTDLPHLKQAFTEGEMWPVQSARIDALLSEGLIDGEQAEAFRRGGALGSHLEILQRDEGYKGFNQAGISQIIHETDPRRVAGA